MKGNSCVPARSIQVPLERVGEWYLLLGQALIQLGASASDAARLLDECLSGRCSQCDLVIRGTELAEAACIGGTGPARGRMARLSLGYCPTKGCSARYYDLILVESDSVSWSTVLELVESLRTHLTSNVIRRESQTNVLYRAVTIRFGRARTVTAVVAVLLAALLAYWSSRAPSWSRPSAAYRADPATTFRPAD